MSERESNCLAWFTYLLGRAAGTASELRLLDLRDELDRIAIEVLAPPAPDAARWLQIRQQLVGLAASYSASNVKLRQHLERASERAGQIANTAMLTETGGALAY